MSYVQTESGYIIETANPSFWPDAKPLSKKAGEAALKAQSMAELRNLLNDGDTVYAVLRHVSASGMRRRIDFYVIKGNEPVYLSGHIANVTGYSRAKKEQGLIVDGCGMDMGFSVTHNLAAVLGIKLRAEWL